MKLQYNAMYFYIVSSFLFKYRDYFISCWGKVLCPKDAFRAVIVSSFIRAPFNCCT